MITGEGNKTEWLSKILHCNLIANESVEDLQEKVIKIDLENA